MRVSDILRKAAALRLTSPHKAPQKALNGPAAPDFDTSDDTQGANVTLARTASGDPARLFRKMNPRLFRNYAEFSPIVRSAIDIYRDCIEMAEWKIVPYDPKKPVKKRIKREIESLLKQPNPAGEPYSTIKGKAVEDYLVVGLGPVEKAIRRNLSPYHLFPLDGARIGVNADWDGLDPKVPRYAEFNQSGQVRRWIPDAMAMVLINRPRSYAHVGLSHVEVLHMAIRAILEGDDTFLQQMIDRTPGGALDLGEGVGKPQVDQVRHEIQQVRKAFIVMGGTKNPSFIRFDASERDIRALDKLLYFKRQVAGIFQLPMAVLGETVDTSRANTEALLENSDKGPGALLWRIRAMENSHITLKFGPYEEHNCMIDYPIMSRRDEKQQAEITSIQTGKSAWASTNEGRRAAGLNPLDLPIADEVLIPTRMGPVPLSRLNEQYFGEGSEPDGDPDSQDAEESEEEGDK
ncbi:MAG: phage portal protein [Acidobacteria bacterium]|nr:phage portal protein [Acidobacteriota bacterium]